MLFSKGADALKARGDKERLRLSRVWWLPLASHKRELVFLLDSPPELGSRASNLVEVAHEDVLPCCVVGAGRASDVRLGGRDGGG